MGPVPNDGCAVTPRAEKSGHPKPGSAPASRRARSAGGPGSNPCGAARGGSYGRSPGSAAYPSLLPSADDGSLRSVPRALYVPAAENRRIPRWSSVRLLDVPPPPRRGQVPDGKSRNGIASEEYGNGAARSRVTPVSAGSQPGSAWSQSPICPTARAKSALIASVDPDAPPGCSTPTARTRPGRDPSDAVSRLSGSAVPPCAPIHVVTDSFAALPTAVTRRTSPSITALSKIRFRWAAIGDRESCASGRRPDVYCPKIGYTKELRNR